MHCSNGKWSVIAILISIAATTVSPGAQQNSENPCLVRKVHVQVEDQSGNPITGLTADNFTPTIANETLAVRRLEASPPLGSVLFLVDMSGSTFNKFSFRAILSLETELKNQFPQWTRLAAVGFNDEMYLDQDFTLDRNLIDEAIRRAENTRWQGATAIYDSLIKCIKHIQQLGLPPENSAIILFTDGQDDMSLNNLKSTEPFVTASGIRVVTVGISSPESGTSKVYNDRARSQLLRFANASGGISIWLHANGPLKEIHGEHREYGVGKDFVNIHEIASDLLRELAKGYELDLALNSMISKPVKWNLEISAAGGGNSQKLTLHYPETLYPCIVTAMN
jgi:Mg-chelatase subunit ChlD